MYSCTNCQNPTQLNSTQNNSKATNVGVRHSSYVFPTPPHPPTLPELTLPIFFSLKNKNGFEAGLKNVYSYKKESVYV